MENTFRCTGRVVSSDLERLWALHLRCGWTPDPRAVRPGHAVRASKDRFLEDVAGAYASHADYVLHTIFGAAVHEDATSRRLVVSSSAAARDETRFVRCAYPYKTPLGTRHFILWYASERPASDEQMEADIERHMRAHYRFSHSMWVAYINPKMSIPNLFHVHVFCITWDDANAETLCPPVTHYRGTASADLPQLQELHERLGWSPSAEQLQCADAVQRQKAEWSRAIHAQYEDASDEILQRCFGLEVTGGESTGKRKHVAPEQCARADPAHRFVRNRFPYDVPSGTQHYLLYFAQKPAPNNSNVERLLTQQLRDLVGHDRFDFLFYRNPFPSITRLLHFHVFWRVRPTRTL